MAKTPIDIEKLLQWAYCDQLPKQALSVESAPWAGVDDYGARGGIAIQESVVPQRYANIGTPHPDALALDYMVRCLEPVQICWPSAIDVLIPDVRACLPSDDPSIAIMRGFREYPAGLLKLYAELKSRPPWDVGQITLQQIKGRNGKPVVCGVTAGRRYAIGAYSPLRLDPAVAEILGARFQYLVWRQALVKLASESWTLRDFSPIMPRAAQAPWFTGPERSPRILETIEPRHRSLTTPRVLAC